MRELSNISSYSIGCEEKVVKDLFGFLCLILLLVPNVFADNADEVKSEVLARTGTSWDGSELPAYPHGEPEITVLRIEIPKGARLPMHKHPVINAGVLLKGELTVTTEQNKTLHLKAGDAIVEVVDKWHFGKNDGEIEAEIIVFYAGIQGEPLTIEQ